MTEIENYDSNTTTLDDNIYKCTCGTPDTSQNWICCDNDDCPVLWYHWECVRVNKEPSGEWLCPTCSLKPTGLLPKEHKANTSNFPKHGKTAVRSSNATLDHQEKGKQDVANKASRTAKKGIAIKKKGKSKWVSSVEMPSGGCKEEHKEGEDAAVGTKPKQTMVRATQSKGRPSRSQIHKEASKRVAGLKKETWMESEDEGLEQEDLKGFVKKDHKQLKSVRAVNRDEHRRLPRRDPKKAAGTSNPRSNDSSKAVNSATPALFSQTRHNNPPLSNPTPPPSASTLPQRQASAIPPIPSSANANGAAMIIDVEEQGWRPTLTTVAADGSKNVQYWSYSKSVWCAMPRPASKGGLPCIR